jgi:hypothetical protein
MEQTMIRMTAFALLVALFSFPAIAQNKGKSGTAPGQVGVGTAPGQQQTAPGDAKTFAPGQNQTAPGGAKDLAPGAGQRKTK